MEEIVRLVSRVLSKRVRVYVRATALESSEVELVRLALPVRISGPHIEQRISHSPTPRLCFWSAGEAAADAYGAPIFRWLGRSILHKPFRLGDARREEKAAGKG